jgi:hypothetical protein
MAAAYASVEDVQGLWRPLTDAEKARAEKLLPVVSDSLRQEARLVGKDLDQMVESGELYEGVLISVVVDVVARTLMTSTEGEPLTQESQGALGYSWSGTYLVPGGGLFIKQSELARLGLKRQRYGVIETWDATSEG